MTWLIFPALAATWTVGADAPSVQATLDLASAGDTVVLPEGDWPGPVVLDKTLTLTSDGGVLDGGGEGHALRVTAPGAVVEGLRVKNSGRDLAKGDACVRLDPSALGAVVRGVEAWDCLFGIWVHESDGAVIEDNTVSGLKGEHNSRKGNGVHLFDASDLIVRGNSVRDSRDGIYVSATEDSLIQGNTAEHVRYGIHYMYSYDNVIRDNVVRHCSGGIALMQSRNLIVENNTSTDNTQVGILFRDAQYSRIAHNTVERNGQGMFFFSSLDNEIVDNRVADNEIGFRIWAGTYRNVVRGNAFIGNRQQIFYVASEDQVWEGDSGGNYWSDYLGWDQDGDGRGDRPYAVDSLIARLLYQAPAAMLLLNSPTLELLQRMQRMLPAVRVPTVIDTRPLVQAPELP
jgi:nitrous oxidase accessory protein